jgi:hypothetical protein
MKEEAFQFRDFSCRFVDRFQCFMIFCALQFDKVFTYHPAMKSKKSRATSRENPSNESLANDSSRMAQPEDGLLFPIAPDTREPLSNSNPEAPAGKQPEPEQLLLPSHDEVKVLCDLAVQIKAIAPWSWMKETEVFGVEDPDSGEIGFVSVMGNIGEFESVAVYRGAEGIFGLIDFQTDFSSSSDRLLEIPQVQLSFSEPKFLEKRDRELLKASGLKFTGARPQFRSFRAGYVPWFITLEEARLLIHALSQTLEMTQRLAKTPFLFPNDGDGETESFLVRVSRNQDRLRRQDPSLGEDHSPREDHPREDHSPMGDHSREDHSRRQDHSGTDIAEPLTPSSSSALVWEDQIKRISRPTPVPIETTIDWDLLSNLKSIRPGDMQLEADLFISPGSVETPNERPLVLYMLMLADRHSGIIVGFEALTAERSFNTMYAGIPERIVSLLWRNKVLPKQIIVRSDLLFALLEPLEEELKIQLRRANELPAIDEAAASITQFLSTGKM